MLHPKISSPNRVFVSLIFVSTFLPLGKLHFFSAHWHRGAWKILHPSKATEPMAFGDLRPDGMCMHWIACSSKFTNNSRNVENPFVYEYTSVMVRGLASPPRNFRDYFVGKPCLKMHRGTVHTVVPSLSGDGEQKKVRNCKQHKQQRTMAITTAKKQPQTLESRINRSLLKFNVHNCNLLFLTRS